MSQIASDLRFAIRITNCNDSKATFWVIFDTKKPLWVTFVSCMFESLLGWPQKVTYKGQKLNTNFFFLKLFGHRRDIPAKSRDIPHRKLISLVSRDISNFSPPTPSRGRSLPHRIRTQRFGFGFFFRAWTLSHFWVALIVLEFGICSCRPHSQC